ncbi:MAG: hypothetical protein RL681_84 [Candidatus Parcubacteria bacterium]|jgi:hypothetical protein
MVTEHRALYFTAGAALLISIVAFLGISFWVAHAVNVGFTTRVTPSEAQDGPPLK